MLTYPVVVHKDARPSYRPYSATVLRIADLSTGMRRVTFTGDSLWTFGTDGLDQRIKIVFPVDGGFGPLDWESELVESGEWYSRWRELPDEQRVDFRTYTVRAVRPERAELDVDVVLHEPLGEAEGPGSRWIRTVQVGHPVVVIGPDAASLNSTDGIDWRPGDATTVLLAGDETAAPAICSILESLPAEMKATAFIEIERAADAQAIVVATDVEHYWIARGAGEARLGDAVADWLVDNRAEYAQDLAASTQLVEDVDVDVELLWEAPERGPGQFYAWLAGESAMIKSLRCLLVSEVGIDRNRVAFMGYWRRGQTEHY